MSPPAVAGMAVRTLLRGGQRVGLAVVCIAFGGMSLVALQLLAAQVSRPIEVDPRLLVGGDVAVERPGRRLTPADLAALARLQAEGRLVAVTPVAFEPALLLRPGETGSVSIVARTLGVDPARFPLVGHLRLQHGAPLALLLRLPGSAVVTRDLAVRMGLEVGQPFTLGGGAAARPARLALTGIVEAMPDLRGDTILVSLETARQLAGSDSPATGALLLGLTRTGQAVLEAEGWTVETPEAAVASVKDTLGLFALMLRGAGLLGLLVGGIGVAHTLQVLLARRREEVAALKTVGWRRRHLVALFGLEALLLGLAGSLLGAGTAVGLSAGLGALLARTGVLLVHWQPEPGIILRGELAGMATALLFALLPILQASAVRPSLLLRQQAAEGARRSWAEQTGLVLVVAALMVGVCAAVTGSVREALVVVGATLAALPLLGLVLGGAVAGLSRLPLPGGGLVLLARRNLQRQPVRAAFALVALCIGVFTIGFAGTVLAGATGQVAQRELAREGPNVRVLAPAAHAERVREALAAEGVADVRLHTQVTATVRGQDGAPLPGLRQLQGRAAGTPPWDMEVEGAPWGSALDGAYVPEPARARVGSTLTVEGPRGAPRAVRVVGTWRARPLAGLAHQRPSGLLVPEPLALELGGGEARMVATGAAPPGRLEALSLALGRALPDAFAVTTAEVSAAVQRTVKSLYAFVVAVAGLALLAGAVLVANTTGLALLDRRRELGVLKAVGFSSTEVLRAVLWENALLGMLGGLAGLGAVGLGVALVNRASPRAHLALGVGQGVLLVAVAMVLAVGSAAAMAWRPTRVRPLAELREE
jgi:putative ABC transport system permease protein